MPKQKTQTIPIDSSVKRIEFVATIPALESAIKIHGDGGARLSLDIPENNMIAFVPVLSLRGRILKVILETA